MEADNLVSVVVIATSQWAVILFIYYILLYIMFGFFSLYESLLNGALDDTSIKGMLNDSCGSACSETNIWPL